MTRASPVLRDRIFRAYWEFAAERHRIFERRLAGEPPPWTDDPILANYRFCNAFRASDRVSQGLIRNAAYGGPSSAEDVFLRVALYRLFSRPSTWDLLETRVGPITASDFRAEQYGKVLDSAFSKGETLYTAAFILAPSSVYGFARKHRNHLALLEAMLADGLPDRVAASESLEAVYWELRKWPMLGPFMAYQLAIDLNYSTILDHSEDEFTVPGPGAIRGLKKVFAETRGWKPHELVRWLQDQRGMVGDEMGIEPPTLLGRPLQLIDCQNLLCEVDKYSRVAFPELSSSRSRIKQTFEPDPEPLRLFYPPKWSLEVPPDAAYGAPRASRPEEPCTGLAVTGGCIPSVAGVAEHANVQSVCLGGRQVEQPEL